MFIRARAALTLALLLPLLLMALSACRPAQPFDPLADTTPFAFEIDNPDGVEGDVFGLLYYPFEPVPFTAELERYGALLNGFSGATLDEDGVMEGSFIAPRDVPRVNDGLGWFGGMRVAERSGPGFGDWLLFPPPECPMSATNPDEATFAVMQFVVIWDGESLDSDGLPVPTGFVELGTYTEESDGMTWTETSEVMVPVMSRAAWSVSSDGPCTFETWAEFTLDVDLDMNVGWQMLHLRNVRVDDGVDYSEQVTLRVVPFEDLTDLSDVWQVRPGMP